MGNQREEPLIKAHEPLVRWEKSLIEAHESLVEVCISPENQAESECRSGNRQR